MASFKGKKEFKVTGNTFGRKAKIKAAGGKWNAGKKEWTVELYSSDALWKWSDLSLTEVSEDNALVENWNEVINEGGEGFQLQS